MTELPTGLGITPDPTGVWAPEADATQDALRVAIRRVQFGVNRVLESWGLTDLCQVPPGHPFDVIPVGPREASPSAEGVHRVTCNWFYPLHWLTVRELTRAGRTLRTGVSVPHALRVIPRWSAATNLRASEAARMTLGHFHRLRLLLSRKSLPFDLILDAVDDLTVAVRRIPVNGWEGIYVDSPFKGMSIIAGTAHQAVIRLATNVLSTLKEAADRAYSARGVKSAEVPFPLSWTAEAGLIASEMFADRFGDSTRKWFVTLDLEAERLRKFTQVVKEPRFRVALLEGTVYIDGEPFETGLAPDLMTYLDVVARRCTEDQFRPIIWDEVCKLPGMKGKNQSRVRGKMSDALRALVPGGNGGHFIRLPPPPKK